MAKAARAGNHLQILSTASSTAVETVNAARGEPVWFQLYPTNEWDITKALVVRADAAGCPVLVLTVDNLGNNRVTQARLSRQDQRNCESCHALPSPRYFIARPMFSGLDTSRAMRVSPWDWNWDHISRLRELTRMKIVVKGIVTGEDAQQARTHGVDGIIVSNHGGRAENSGRGAIECLREVVEGAGSSMPVLVDSGFRRGTGYLQSARARRNGGVHRAALRLGPCGLRSAWRGTSAEHPAPRAGAGDASGRHDVARSNRHNLRRRSRALVIPVPNSVAPSSDCPAILAQRRPESADESGFA